MGWFGRRKPRSVATEVLETVVGPSTTLAGTIRSDGGVRIEGQFEGVIDVGGNVVVAKGAVVLANIRAKDVVVGGVVKGDIEGPGRVEILASGQVFGDLVVGSVMIDEGGLFEGISRMRGAAAAPKALAAPAPPPPTDELLIDLGEAPKTAQPAMEVAAAEAQATNGKAARPGAAKGGKNGAATRSKRGSSAPVDLSDLDFDIDPVIPGAEPNQA